MNSLELVRELIDKGQLHEAKKYVDLCHSILSSGQRAEALQMIAGAALNQSSPRRKRGDKIGTADGFLDIARDSLVARAAASLIEGGMSQWKAFAKVADDGVQDIFDQERYASLVKAGMSEKEADKAVRAKRIFKSADTVERLYRKWR